MSDIEFEEGMKSFVDPICLFHGKRMSEHVCIVCCICFKVLTLEECHVLPDGTRENVCNTCANFEADAEALDKALEAVRFAS